MLPGFGKEAPSGMCFGGTSSGLGSQEEEAARLREVRSNLERNYREIQATYGPGINSIANLTKAVDSGDPAEIQRQLVNTVASIATLAGPVGAILGAVLRVFQALGDWLCEAYPARAVDCFWDGQHLRHACQMYKGNYDDGMLEQVYLHEGRFWLGTTLTRGSKLNSFYVAGNSENLSKWSDPPMVASSGIINLDGGSVEEKKLRLKDFCIPRRQFISVLPPPFTGARSWNQYLTDHPDPDGSTAARKIGDEVWSKLIRDGDPKLFSGAWGDLCWHTGFLVTCRGFTDETLVSLIRMMFDTQGPAADVAAAAGIVVPEETTGGGLWYWKDWLSFSIFHHIRMSQYGAYHMKALLDEYNRRGLGSSIPAMSLSPSVMFNPSVVVEPAETKPKSKPMSTGAKVAIGGGIAAAVAGALKLLKVW